MDIRASLSVFSLSVVGVVLTAHSQTTLNPDISLVPRFRLESNDGQLLPERRVFSRPEFTLEEFELGVQGYLNPYARADVFIAKSGVGEEPIEIEEAYATFLRGLPLDLNIRIGKYLTDFGKLNMLHPHAWPFLSKPLSLERFLGQDGLNDLGISASLLIPTGDVVYTKLSLDVLRGNSIGVIDPAETVRNGGPGLLDTVSAVVYYANAARLMTFFPVGESSDLEIGVSGLTGIHDPFARLRFFYGNIDFKFKWKPSSYTSLVLQGEGLINSRKVVTATRATGPLSEYIIRSGGFYVFGNLQFNNVFSIGVRYDWSQSPYSAYDKTEGASVFAGYYPVEETAAFRLQYQHTRTLPRDEPVSAVNTFTVQVMFSLGPHKAHPF